jgi:hypothetical protein
MATCSIAVTSIGFGFLPTRRPEPGCCAGLGLLRVASLAACARDGRDYRQNRQMARPAFLPRNDLIPYLSAEPNSGPALD